MPCFFSVAEMIKFGGKCNSVQSLMHTNFLTKFISGNGWTPLNLEPSEIYQVLYLVINVLLHPHSLRRHRLKGAVS